ncbi:MULTISPECIES: branched-chain amino acid ABC transporter permease [Herbaspirillum]|uniref:Amino acid ABC transporter permease n=1 Tax=Herbaspirillum frisingense GSF30 TaxID=864073 RepID=A0AAI9IF11_9BURK|nr:MULTISPECIES: branched-chain amino acid ABC transporter permease [Herbaspirillum]EOA04982.1 amino acid ABC transporter permease [Herbaspirillum frisingense GSF30]ONN64545.1 branched-chain amino acid ABC transporter permease [Herbaspirillum sp. VT-16-41]
MNLQIVALLGQDGITNGAIYALLALSIVLVFTVTRILLIPQGEFVSFGALTMGMMQNGQPLTVAWLLVAMCLGACVFDLYDMWRSSRRRPSLWLPAKLVYAAVVAGVALSVNFTTMPMLVQVLMTLLLLVPMGPLMYRMAFQPIASASPLVLLIVSIAVHVALVGVALLVFGPEGARTAPFTEAALEVGSFRFSSQALWVICVSLLLIVGLFLMFERTLYGKALRAAALNRMGARLMGISPVFAGKAMFLLASLIGVMSGVLIAPITTIYYDSGFLISLKGFVGSIIGGLVSYPVAAVGALAIGLIESFSTFWASAYKEIIVFVLIIPILLWRSLSTRHVEEEE